jgi:hypothetical protein
MTGEDKLILFVIVDYQWRSHRQYNFCRSHHTRIGDQCKAWANVLPPVGIDTGFKFNAGVVDTELTNAPPMLLTMVM